MDAKRWSVRRGGGLILAAVLLLVGAVEAVSADPREAGDAIAVEVWVRLDEGLAEPLPVIARTPLDASAVGPAWGLSLTPGGSWRVDAFDESGVAYLRREASAETEPVADGGLHQIAFAVEVTASGRELVFYHDGREVARRDLPDFAVLGRSPEAPTRFNPELPPGVRRAWRVWDDPPADFGAVVSSRYRDRTGQEPPAASEGGDATDEDRGRLEVMSTDEAMERWIESGTPGRAHERLMQRVGRWDAEMRMWWDPGEPPATSEAEVVVESILGGRFIEERLTGTMMGQPYESRLTLGFSKPRQQYVGTSIDSLNTGMIELAGAASREGDAITLIAVMDEPMTGEIGKAAKWRIVFESEDVHRVEIHEILYGEPFKVVEVVMRRRITDGETEVAND